MTKLQHTQTHHECYAEGCEATIPNRMLMCYPHWKRVPKSLQDDVYDTWNALHDENPHNTMSLDVLDRAYRAARDNARDSVKAMAKG